MSDKKVLPEPQMKVLEAMSLIYEICLKKDEYKIPTDTDFYHQILKTYNDLQILRDDSTFIDVDTKLDDKFLKKQRAQRVEELCKPPFGAPKEPWIK